MIFRVSILNNYNSTYHRITYTSNYLSYPGVASVFKDVIFIKYFECCECVCGMTCCALYLVGQKFIYK